MNKIASLKILENEKLMNHLIEHSYYIKDLNRDPNNIKKFINDMKVIYKERPSDKVNDVVDKVEMISEIIDMVK